LTSLGEEVVRFALDRYGSADVALAEFENWQRSRKRFYDLAPEWGLLTRRVLWEYPATKLIVEELQALHEDGEPAPSLVGFVRRLHRFHPTFTVELFLRGTDDVRSRRSTLTVNCRSANSATATCTTHRLSSELKAMLYHAGVLTERGSEPNKLDPETDTWALREPLDYSA